MMTIGILRHRSAQYLAAGVLVLGGLVAPTSIAAAVPPYHGSYSYTSDFLDPEYCAAEGLIVAAHMVEEGQFELFIDENGDVYKGTWHHDVRFTLRADGHPDGPVLNERDRWQTFFTVATGIAREVGDTAHITGAHGIVLHDSGQLVFTADDTLLYMHGPHPQFMGGTFCSSLL